MTEDAYWQSQYVDGVNKFQSIRSKAFLSEMFSLLRGQSTELLSFDVVRERLRLREERYRGLQDIPLNKIVGSVGRYKDFTATFLPKMNEMRERWSRVYATMNSMQGVPPIAVYQIGDAYFVRDGNHRVSVARQIGSKTIQAHVTELPAPITLAAGTTIADLDAAALYVDFLEQTDLRRTRPALESMQLSNPACYGEILAHIDLHGQVLETQVGHTVTMADAAADWYDKIYLPAVDLIRKYAVLNRTGEDRKRTEADLYIWMVDHLRDIRQQQNESAQHSGTFSQALVNYLSEKKIPIPPPLVSEDDDTVVLSRTQAMHEVNDEDEA